MSPGSLPPGPVYLARFLARAIPPSIAAYTSFIFIPHYFHVAVPQELALFATFFAYPAYILLSVVWTNVINRMDARRKGAVMLPKVPDWPGGFGVVKAMVKSFKSGYPGDIFLQWCNLYGNAFILNVASENRIVTVEPDHVKCILATQFEYFDKGPVTNSQFSSLLGTGVFNADGDMWKFHRTMTRPFFRRDRITHFDIFDRHADDALVKAKHRLAEGHLIDFQDLVSRFTLDSATEFLFGHDVRSLSAALPYPPSSPFAFSGEQHSSDRFVTAFLQGQLQTSLRTRFGLNWPLAEFFQDRIRKPRQIVDEFVAPIIEEALRRRGMKSSSVMGEKIEDNEAEKETLLDSLLEKTQDFQILKDELVNLLVAGRDTTAATLTFAVYMLTQHPSIIKRLRDEIMSVVGPKERPSYDQIKVMRYLRAFINEVLRLYPPVPFDSRTSNQATVWPSKTPGQSPFYIPAHTKCTYSVFLMHRRMDLWGPDALEFDPERFLDARLNDYLTPNPFIFLPFNAGPRICLGQQFAYNEVSFFLVRLLQRFSAFRLEQPAELCPPAEWNQCEGTKGKDKVLLGIHLTMYVKGGLWVTMEPAPAVDEVE